MTFWPRGTGTARAIPCTPWLRIWDRLCSRVFFTTRLVYGYIYICIYNIAASWLIYLLMLMLTYFQFLFTIFCGLVYGDSRSSCRLFDGFKYQTCFPSYTDIPNRLKPLTPTWLSYFIYPTGWESHCVIVPEDDGQQFPRAWRCVLQLVARQCGELSCHTGKSVTVGQAASIPITACCELVVIYGFEWISVATSLVGMQPFYILYTDTCWRILKFKVGRFPVSR